MGNGFGRVLCPRGGIHPERRRSGGISVLRQRERGHGAAAAGSRLSGRGEYPALLKEQLDRGLSFPAARQRAAEGLLGPDAAPLSRPNNTLGIEYLRALHALGSPIRPVTVKREGAGHNEAAVFAGDATREETNRLFWQHNPTLSATAIRCHLAEGDWKRIAPYLPPEGLALLRENMVEPGGLTRLERAVLGLLTKWFSKKTVLKKVQEKAISAIKTTKTGQENQSLFSK